MSDEEYRKIQQIIKNKYGLTLNDTKRNLIEQHAARRIKVLNLNSYKEYFDALFSYSFPNEVKYFIDAITTHKTDFFREERHFDYLKEELLDDLFARQREKHVKIWSAGCSSGEEVYTLAITLEEYAYQMQKVDYSIVGSDLSPSNIKKAIKGIYPMNRVENLPYDLKKKYFLRSSNGNPPMVKVKPLIARNLDFKTLNLNATSYVELGIQKFHIIFCRNTLIYFGKEEQLKIINKLHKHLLPHGYLFLGHSESLFGFQVPFKQVKPAVYQKI